MGLDASKSKGFIHAVEGVMASLVLIVYLASTAPPSVQKSSWDANILRQTGSEYLESLQRANLSYLVFEDRQDALAGINRYFFPASSVLIASETLPKSTIRVGIISNSTNNYNILFSQERDESWCTHPSRGWTTELSCMVEPPSNPLGVRLVLADTDNGVFNGILDYDSVYVDMDNDNKYGGTSEGPYAPNDIFQLGQNYYSVGYIDNSSKSAMFWDAAWLMKFRSNMLPTEINSREISFMFYNANLSRSTAQFDALIIAGAMDIAPYQTALRSFLSAGKGVVEIADLSDANFNSVQASIFGLNKVGYAIIGSSDIVTLGGATFPEPLGIADYFSIAAMRLDAPITDASGYDVSGIPNQLSIRIGTLNTTAGAVNIAVAKNSSTHDVLYIDTNNDKDFSNPLSDLTGYKVGDSFTARENSYSLKEIEPYGTYVLLLPDKEHTFIGIANPLNISSAGGEAVLEKDKYYAASTNGIGAVFTINLYATPVLGNPGTLPSGAHKYGTISEADSSIYLGEYNISATNASTEYRIFNIDFNGDGAYNGAGEGPFPGGETIKIGPESYRVSLSSDGSKASFRLMERERVPLSLANYLYNGRAVWMPDITGRGHDAWAYIKAAVLWASGKKAIPEGGIKTQKDIISVKRVFVSSDGAYVPYEVEMNIGQ